MTNLSQRDPRWNSLPLGNSPHNLGGSGCTVTSLAIYIGTTPDVVVNRMMAVGGLTPYGLVIWAKVKEAFPGVFIEEPFFRNYDNAAVLSNLPCLVEVDFDGTDRVDNRHWVVYIGGQQMIDPWTGNVELTSKYKALSYRAIKGRWNKEQIVAPTANADYFEMDGLKINYNDRASMFETFKVWVAVQKGKLIDAATAVTPERLKSAVDASESCQRQLGAALEQNGRDQETIKQLQADLKEVQSKYEDEQREVKHLNDQISEIKNSDKDYASEAYESGKLAKEAKENIDMLTEAANLDTKFDSAPLHEKAKAVANKLIKLQEDNEELSSMVDSNQSIPEDPPSDYPVGTSSRNFLINFWRLFFN